MKRFRASALPRLSTCHGSHQACEQVELSPTGEYALEGVRLHHSATLALQVTEDDLSDEQNRAVHLCKEIIDDAKRGSNWHFFEHYMECELTKDITLTGHCDFIVRHGPGLIAAWDWKYGWYGIQDQAIWQAKGYALLAMETWADCNRLEFIMYAPRTDSRMEYTVTRGEVPALRAEIVEILQLASEPDAELVPSNEACQYCAAAYKCPALIRTLRKTPISPVEDISELTAYRDALKIASRISKWATDIKSSCKAIEMSNPGSFPGYELVSQPANRKVGDLPRLYEAIKDTLLPREILSCSNVAISKLETLFSERYHEQTGETKTKGRELFKKLVLPALEPGTTKFVFRKETKHGRKVAAPIERGQIADGSAAITGPDSN